MSTVDEVRDASRASKRCAKKPRKNAAKKNAATRPRASLFVDTSLCVTSSPAPSPTASPASSPSKADVTLQYRIMRVKVGSWTPTFAMNSLLETICDNLKVANVIHVSTVLHRLATVVASDRSLQPRLLEDERFQRLLRQTEVLIPAACPRAVTTTAWALGKLEAKDGRLLRVIASYIEANLTLLDAQGVANTLYAFALLQFRQERLLLKLVRHLPSILGAMKPQEISNAVYALARLSFYDAKALRAVTDFVVPRVAKFKTQELSNLVYSHAMLNVQHEAFCAAAEKEMVDRNFVDWLGQDLSNTVFGFSRLGFRCERLFKAVRNHGLAFLGQLNLNALSMTLSGFALLNLVDPVVGQVACDHVVACLSARVFTRLSVVTMADLLNLLQSLVRFRVANLRPDFASEIANFVASDLAAVGSVSGIVELLNVATQLTKLNADVRPLLDKCGDYISRHVEFMRWNNISSLLDLYTKTPGSVRSDVLSKTAANLIKLCHKIPIKNVLEIAFNLTALGYRQTDIFRAAKYHYVSAPTSSLGAREHCRAIVCFLRGAMVNDLEKACMALADEVDVQFNAQLDPELAVATFRFLAKYHAEKPSHGRIRVVERLLNFARSRITELAPSDLLTMCECAPRVLSYVHNADVLLSFFTSVVQEAMAQKSVAHMSPEDLVVIFSAINELPGSSSKHDLGVSALDTILKMWLPSARLNSFQYANILAVINPYMPASPAAALARG